MTARTAHAKGSSAIPLWGALGVVAIGLVAMWALPESRTIVGTGLVVGGALVGVLVVLRRHLTPETSAEHDENAPLHLRD